MDMPKLEPVEYTSDGKRLEETWRLLEDFHVRVGGSEFTVPAGFVTDGASIPRMLWRICGHPMSTKRLPIAIAHDWMYSGATCLTRQEADAIYRDGLVELGFPKWKANIEYSAIRLFGGSHWQGV